MSLDWWIKNHTAQKQRILKSVGATFLFLSLSYKEILHSWCNNTITQINFPEQFSSKEIILNFINKSFYSISPNPNNGIFDIKFENESIAYIIKVFNVFGETVYLFNAIDKVLQLNLSDLSKGVYFIAVDFEKTRSVKKILIQ